MNLFKMAVAFSPAPTPQIDIPTKSNISFAGKVGKGTLTIDIALPKEHLAEIAAGAMMIQQQMMQPQIGGSAGPDLEPFKDMSTWVKCRNPACGHAWEMNLKEYFKYVEKHADPRSTKPPALVCKKCGQKSVYRAVKCAKCGFTFERGTVPADFADRCPKCRYSKVEEDRKKAAEARKKTP
jgi:predicted Zn-ribbon and HTH transcriptional regulator